MPSTGYFFWWSLFFPGMSDILLFWQFSIIDFRIFCFGFVLFSCTSKMPFIYILDPYFQTFLSVILSTCFHLLFSFAFCAVFENCFLHHPLCFWSWVSPPLIYLLVLQWYWFCHPLLSSTASFTFIWFWCPLISSVIESLLIVDDDFLVCPFPSEKIEDRSFPCYFCPFPFLLFCFLSSLRFGHYC